jgi:hypothetical protein
MKSCMQVMALAILMSVCSIPAFASDAKKVDQAVQATVVASPFSDIDVNLIVNGVVTTGTMTITGFTTQGRQLVAIATLTFATIAGIITETVLLPASVTGSCSILDLHIGAISLNLLGLQVDLAAVDLDIVAQTGAGNLLGNLLCAITNLLNSNAAGNAITRLVGLLNEVVATL